MADYAKKLVIDIDLNGLQIKNLKPEVVTALPSTAGPAGTIIYYSGHAYVSDGTKYNMLSEGGDVSELEGKVSTNTSDISTLKSSVGTNTSDISALKTTVGDASAGLVKSVADNASAIEGKVDKVSGKRLSTNDYTTDEKTKLSGIATGAQVNVIEAVQVNGTAVTPSGKTVNIDLSNYATKSDVSSIPKFKTEIVTTLPTGSSIDLQTLYLKADENAAAGSYIEYIGIAGTAEDGSDRKLEQIGTTKIDLSGYVDTTTLTTELAKKQNSLSTAQLAAANSGITAEKVTTYDGYASTIAGKQDALSETQLKAVNSGIEASDVTKLDAIASGAQVNVIESVKVNNTALSVTDKAVNIDLSTYATTTALEDGLKGKQGTLSTAQQNAVDSGITKAKVTTYDGYSALITTAQTAADNAKSAADAKQDKIVAGTEIAVADDGKTISLALTNAHKSAVDSGITATKVSTYDGYAATIAKKAGVYEATISGDGSTETFSVPAASVTNIAAVTVFDSDGVEVIPYVKLDTTANKVIIGFNTAPASGVTYTVRVVAI